MTAYNIYYSLAILISLLLIRRENGLAALSIVILQSAFLVGSLLGFKTIGVYGLFLSSSFSPAFVLIKERINLNVKTQFLLFFIPLWLCYLFRIFHWPGFSIISPLLILSLVIFIYFFLKYKKYRRIIGFMPLFVPDILIYLYLWISFVWGF